LIQGGGWQSILPFCPGQDVIQMTGRTHSSELTFIPPKVEGLVPLPSFQAGHFFLAQPPQAQTVELMHSIRQVADGPCILQSSRNVCVLDLLFVEPGT
jgi:hypothetical protein